MEAEQTPAGVQVHMFSLNGSSKVQQQVATIKRWRDPSPPEQGDDGFTTVRAKGRKRTPKAPTQPSAPTPVANSFSPLKNIRPPPIVLPASEYTPFNVTTFIKSEIPGASFIVQGSKNDIKIFCVDDKSYDSNINIFRNRRRNIQFYTYSKKGAKPNKKYLILGLNVEHPMESITQAVAHDDLIDVRRLTRTNPDGTKRFIEPILATFKPSYNFNTHLKNIRAIDHIIVHVKPYSPNRTIPQCQAFNHTKNNCGMLLKCVRCAGEHKVNDCPRATAPLKCANCAQEHPASYRQCPYRLKRLEEIKARKEAKKQPAPAYVPAPPPTTNAWTTQAPAPAPASHNTGLGLPLPTPPVQAQPQQADPNGTPQWVQNLTNTLTTMFNNMMNMVSRLIDTFTQLANK